MPYRCFKVDEPVPETFFESVGRLRYGRTKLVLDVDQEIVKYYMSLMPKYIGITRQRYAAHISVVRNEVPHDLSLWDLHEGEQIRFRYSNIIRCGTVYFWLNVFSTRLEEIREELGLPVSSLYNVPPPGYRQTFHITLGNKKGQ